MKRKNLLLLVVFVLGVGAILSLSVSDLSLLQPKRELIELSVIIREADSTTRAAARQGMEQAAGDLGAELRFLTLTTTNSVQEQRTLLQREVEGGADGIILVPADPAALADDVKKASEKSAVLTLESDMTNSGAFACISTDNAALGTALGKAVLNGVPPGGTVLLLDSSPLSTGISARLNAAAKALEDSNRVVQRHIFSDHADLWWDQSPQAVLAFEPSALEQAFQKLQGKRHPPLLYGMGSTSSIAAGLEQGTITAIAAQNEFAVGYLAVEEVVRVVLGKSIAPLAPMEFSMVRQENMYQMENQKLLFPVTR